jgi:thiol-disulfide isomerase/thioredoxin
VRLRTTIAAAAVLPLLLTACTATRSATLPSKGEKFATESNVDVNTPALRAAKRAAGVEGCQAGTATRPSATLPDLTLPCLGGGPDVDLSKLQGPMVINLFAQWCGPCRTELPYYQRLHKQAGGKVKVVGIDYLDTQPAGALDLVKRSGVTFPLLADPAGNLRVPFRVHGLPGVVFVDKHGRVTDVEFAVMRSYGQLTALVKQHLGVTL